MDNDVSKFAVTWVVNKVVNKIRIPNYIRLLTYYPGWVLEKLIICACAPETFLDPCFLTSLITFFQNILPSRGCSIRRKGSSLSSSSSSFSEGLTLFGFGGISSMIRFNTGWSAITRSFSSFHRIWVGQPFCCANGTWMHSKSWRWQTDPKSATGALSPRGFDGLAALQERLRTEVIRLRRKGDGVTGNGSSHHGHKVDGSVSALR